MSLDSVELIVSFEDYFGISIPDKEAETIYTVQNLCDSVCRHLAITASHPTLRDDVFKALINALQKTGLTKEKISLNDPLKVFLTNEPVNWKLLADETNFMIPELAVVPKDSFVEKIFLAKHWTAKTHFDTLRFSDLCDVICAANCEQLMRGKKAGSSYEVYIAVMAITADKTGVDLYDIKPHKSFTDDFGID